MSRYSILRNAANIHRAGLPSKSSVAVPAAGGGFYGGVRDPSGKTVEYSDKDDKCPVCHTERYDNKKMRLLVSPCYHKMCESCIERRFSQGPAPCPMCGRQIRKNAFMTQTFEDLGVEREIAIRRRIAKEFNKRRENFSDLQAYNDYLEEVETISFNLINNIDVEETEKRIAAYREENAALIELNIQREEREMLTAQEEEEREREERQRRAEEIRREEENERAERTKASHKILEELARGNADARKVVAQSRAEAAKRAEQRAAAAKAASMATLSNLKRKNELAIPDPPHKPLIDDWYAYEDKYVLRREYQDGVMDHISEDVLRQMRIGGYRVEDAWDRAIRYAVAGLESQPLVGLPS